MVGIGVDILRIERIAATCGDDDPFIRKVFTEKERAQAKERSNPFLFYASRFSGKEAVFKTLDIEGNRIDLREIEILSTKTGQPQVMLYGQIKNMADEKGVSRILLSLSHDAEYVIAFAQALDMKD